MKVYPSCFPCFFRQATFALEHAGIDGTRHSEILKDVSKCVAESDLSLTPAHVTTFIHRLVRSRVGSDPFHSVKYAYNEKALNMYGTLKKMVEQSEDPLLTAVRLSIAGNIIDFGILTSIDIEGAIERSLNENIAVDNFDSLKEHIVRSKKALYLLDNAGEIVFDRLLIETMKDFGIHITAVVKGSPVLNDALKNDAIQTGLDKVCRIIDNGSDAVGTILEWCSKEFVEEFFSEELIISKGQGNFETLINEEKSNVYFLFQAKCNVVAKHLGLKKGAMVLSSGFNQWKQEV